MGGGGIGEERGQGRGTYEGREIRMHQKIAQLHLETPFEGCHPVS